jgi:Uma2 family endonuclease
LGVTTAAQRRTSQAKSSSRAKLAADDPVYPHSDGKPLGESEPHLQCIRWLLDAVEDVLRGRDEVSIHGDMFWYWREGHPRENRAPDVMVLFGVPMDPKRLSYKSWEHRGIVPAVIIETASAEQEDQLLREMRDDYERLGVREYFVFDWSNHYLKEPLYGFRLRGRRYQTIRPSVDGCLLSQQLGVKMRAEGRMLRFVDARTGGPVPTRQERLGILQREMARLQEMLKKAGLDPEEAK